MHTLAFVAKKYLITTHIDVGSIGQAQHQQTHFAVDRPVRDWDKSVYEWEMCACATSKNAIKNESIVIETKKHGKFGEFILPLPINNLAKMCEWKKIILEREK